jgi:poly(A) polymerase
MSEFNGRFIEHGTPQEIVEFSAALEALGERAFLVGGAVRDLSLGRSPKDFDLVATVPLEKIAGTGASVAIAGNLFRHLRVTYKDVRFEVSVLPEEDAARLRELPPVSHADINAALMPDAMSRDCHINAIYADPIRGYILDPVAGIPDLVEKRIDIIGDPMIRLAEDPLRILRLIRQASRLDLAPGASAVRAAKLLSENVATVNQDRLLVEVTRQLTEGYALKATALMVEWGVHSYLLPSLETLDSTGSAGVFLRTALGALDAHASAGGAISPALAYSVLLWPAFAESTPSPKLAKSIDSAFEQVMHAQPKHFGVADRLGPQVREIFRAQYAADDAGIPPGLQRSAQNLRTLRQLAQG